MSDFFRFPHTPHLIWLGAGQPRADKVLTFEEREAVLQHELIIEEKVDGANVGFSLSPDGDLLVQNRGQYLVSPYKGQFAKLPNWLAIHEDRLFEALGENLIAFGEWCAARHSLYYTALPDWWLLFDVYDKQSGRFFNVARRNAWAQKAGVTVVHQIAKGHFTLESLKMMLDTPSYYREGNLEGLVLRQEKGEWLHRRAKLVRPEFVQSLDEHWSRRSFQWNRRVFLPPAKQRIAV